MKEVLTLSFALALVCALASGVLAIAQSQTQDARAQAQLKDKSRALKSVLPAYTNDILEDSVDVEHGGGEVRFFRARQDGQLVAIAGQAVSTKGFGGAVEVLVGLEPAGNVRKVVITRHSETPGLGTEVTDRKQKKTITDWTSGKKEQMLKVAGLLAPNRFLDDFEKYNLSETTTFKVDKDGGELQAVAGATITSRAVADAVSRIAAAFAENRNTITSASNATKLAEKKE